MNVLLMQKIVSANEELLKSQAALIKKLSNEIFEKEKQIDNISQKFSLL